MKRSRLLVVLSMALVLAGVLCAGAFAAEKVLTIAYNDSTR